MMKIIVFLFFYLFTFPGSYISYKWLNTAASETSTTTSYENIKKDIINNHLEERQLNLSVYIINHQMRKMSSEISHITDRIFKAQAQSQDLAQNIIQLEKTIKLDQKKLAQRLRLIYGLKDQFFLKILFSSIHSDDLNKNIFFLKKMNQKEIRVIRKLKKNIGILNTSKDRMKNKVASLVSLKNILEEKKKALDETQKYKMTLITQIKKERDVRLSEIESLKETLQTEHVEFKTSFFERKGKMRPPVNYEVTTPYGVIRDSEYRYRLTHKGHFYQAPRGIPVYNVHSGRVAYSGVIEGYGKTVIVDHNDHYYTIYAGQDSITVTKDQELAERDVLGLVGFSQRHQTTGTYFEMRHFSDAMDPKPWLMAIPQSPSGRKIHRKVNGDTNRKAINITRYMAEK